MEIELLNTIDSKYEENMVDIENLKNGLKSLKVLNTDTEEKVSDIVDIENMKKMV